MRSHPILALAVSALIGCAGALAAIGIVLQIADTARQWITRVDKQVRPYLEAVEGPELGAFLVRVGKAQKAADAFEQCGRTAEKERQCDAQRRELQVALENLFAAGRPYGVQVENEERLYGARPGNILGVPSPASIVGVQEDGSWSAPDPGVEH